MKRILNNIKSTTGIIRPYIEPGSHPVETGRYVLATKQINNMCNAAEKWIANRTPGGIIYGRPRLGKTRAISYLISKLSQESPLPVFFITMRQYKMASENYFFEDLLRDVGHGILSGNSSVKRDRLNKFLIEQSMSNVSRRIIFVIDDAQRLLNMHFNWLMDIHNELDREGISMTVILVGQEELKHQRSAFLNSKQFQIVGRFMVNEYEFKGLSSVEDFEFCLSGYDDNSEFPDNSGFSFTQYYFPDAFVAHNFRLQHYAEELFEAFKELKNSNGIRGKLAVPMQYVAGSIECLMKDLGVSGSNIKHIGIKHWKEAIENSGYVQAELFSELYD